jgi:predicted nucleotidyltransferase
MLASIDHATAFRVGKRVELFEQRAIQRRRAVREQMHQHRTPRRDFARLKRARAFIALEVEKLKPIRERHSVLL